MHIALESVDVKIVAILRYNEKKLTDTLRCGQLLSIFVCKCYKYLTAVYIAIMFILNILNFTFLIVQLE